jgi:hypothetical protein
VKETRERPSLWIAAIPDWESIHRIHHMKTLNLAGGETIPRLRSQLDANSRKATPLIETSQSKLADSAARCLLGSAAPGDRRSSCWGLQFPAAPAPSYLTREESGECEGGETGLASPLRCEGYCGSRSGTSSTWSGDCGSPTSLLLESLGLWAHFRPRCRRLRPGRAAAAARDRSSAGS